MKTYSIIYKGQHDNFSSRIPQDIDYGYESLDIGDFIIVLKVYDCGLDGGTLQPICDYVFGIYKKVNGDIEFLYENDTDIFSVDNIYGGMVKCDNNKFIVGVKDTVSYCKIFSVDSSGNLTLDTTFNIDDLYADRPQKIFNGIYTLAWNRQFNTIGLYKIESNDVTFLDSYSFSISPTTYLDDIIKLNDTQFLYSIRYTSGSDVVKFGIIDITSEEISLLSEQEFPHNVDGEIASIVYLQYLLNNIFLANYSDSSISGSYLWLCENDSGVIVPIVGVPLSHSIYTETLIKTDDFSFISFYVLGNNLDNYNIYSFDYTDTDITQTGFGSIFIESATVYGSRFFTFSVENNNYIVFKANGEYYLLSDSSRSATLYYGVNSVNINDQTQIEE